MIVDQVMGQNCPQNTNYYIYGHTFFGHNSAILWPIGLKCFLGAQETIIYRWVMRNHDLDTFLKKSIFGGKISRYYRVGAWWLTSCLLIFRHHRCKSYRLRPRQWQGDCVVGNQTGELTHDMVFVYHWPILKYCWYFFIFWC